MKKKRLKFREATDDTVSRTQWLRIEKPTGDLANAIDLEADVEPPKPTHFSRKDY
jgi:hypothetical protein